ncbi:TPA: hypothetical protein ACH3X1_005819 [Trebouxia sp. C0004]
MPLAKAGLVFGLPPGQEPPKVSTRNAKWEYLSSSEQRLLNALTRLSTEEQSHMLRWAILHVAHNDAAATTTCDVHGTTDVHAWGVHSTSDNTNNNNSAFQLMMS